MTSTSGVTAKHSISCCSEARPSPDVGCDFVLAYLGLFRLLREILLRLIQELIDLHSKNETYKRHVSAADN